MNKARLEELIDELGEAIASEVKTEAEFIQWLEAAVEMLQAHVEIGRDALDDNF